MKPLVECVPNFSEGRNPSTIDKIAEAIRTVKGAFLLDVDSSFSANRTVMTFVGEPQAVCEAAFGAIAMAQSLIDMREHKGGHPRIGAADVCPLVPLREISMEDCITLSRRLAERVGQELNIPIYLYAESAESAPRRSLAFIRRGQYEGLEERMKSQTFLPDYGPTHFNAQAGATAVGARQLLIAYNINLETRSKQIASEIAREIRRSRTITAEQDQRSIEADRQFTDSAKPMGEIIGGSLRDCTALGWYIEEYKCAQVSMNLMNWRQTSLHHAYWQVKRLAAVQHTSVTGSEIIGLVPLAPLLEAGRFYLESKGKSSSASNEVLIDLVIDFLNLRDTRPFDPRAKILDYRLQALFG